MLLSIRSAGDVLNEDQGRERPPLRLPITTGSLRVLPTAAQQPQFPITLPITADSIVVGLRAAMPGLLITTGSLAVAVTAERDASSILIPTGITVALIGDSTARLAITTGSLQVRANGAALPIRTGSIQVSLAQALSPVRISIPTGINVALATGDAFGFTRDLVIAAQADLATTLLDRPVLLGITFGPDQDFRSAANGGRIQQTNAEDVQFALISNGAVLNHNIVSHDPINGTIIFDLQLSSWTVTQDVPVRMSYGFVGQMTGRIGITTGISVNLAANSGIVFVYPMAIDDPTRAGDIIRPAFNAQIAGLITTDPPGDATNARGHCANPVDTAANKIYDYRGQVGVMHDLRSADYQYSMWEITDAEVNAIICGGKVQTLNTTWLNATWRQTHGDKRTGFNAPGLWFSDWAAGVKFQGFYLKDMHDGIEPRAEGWVVENICIRSNRDDCIQNDDQYSGTIRNAYLDGWVLLSVRPGEGSRNTANLHSIVTFENCVIRQRRMPFDGEEDLDAGVDNSQMENRYTNPDDAGRHTLNVTGTWFAAKSCFKSQVEPGGGDLYKARVNMKNCIILYESPAIEGPARTYFPGLGDGIILPGGTNTGSRYENVILCVVAEGGWNAISSVQTADELTAMGIRVVNADGTQERLAYDTFKAIEDDWFTQNDYNQTTDDFSWNRPSVVTPTQPANQIRPHITPTTAAVGDTLNCSQGQWTGTGPINYAYRWLRNGTNIGGALGGNSAYLTVAADQDQVLTCRVTASNSISGPTGVSEISDNSVTVMAAGSSPFVLVATPHWTTLPAANISIPAFDSEGSNTYAPATNRGIDLRGKVGHQHRPGLQDEFNTVIMNVANADGASIFGFKVIGHENPPQAVPAGQPNQVIWQMLKFGSHHGFITGSLSAKKSWDECYIRLTAGSGSSDGEDYHVECFALYGPFDGVIPAAQINNGRAVLTQFYMRDCYDEAVQNDNYRKLICRDFLIDGCYTFVSTRRGGDSTVTSTHAMEFHNGLIRMGRYAYFGDWGVTGGPSWGPNALFTGRYVNSTNRGLPTLQAYRYGYAHANVWKDGAGHNGPVNMTNCLIYDQGITQDGTQDLRMPPGTYTNVLYLFVGETPFVNNLPTGITLNSNRDQCDAIWARERDRWLLAHGNTALDGNDFDFLHA